MRKRETGINKFFKEVVMKTRHILVTVLSILLIFCQTVSGARRVQALSAPINIDAIAVSSSQINLTWDDVNSGKSNETGYSIERSLSEDRWLCKDRHCRAKWDII